MQALLPLVAEGATRINDTVSVVRENGQWTYFCGVQPAFTDPDHRGTCRRIIGSLVLRDRTKAGVLTCKRKRRRI